MGELFIDGAWIDGEGRELTSIDPATGAPIWSGRAATQAQVHDAMGAARNALRDWQSTPLSERVELLYRFGTALEGHREWIAKVISQETGKPTWESLTEVASMVSKIGITIQAHAERTGTRETELDGFRSVVRHRPHGVMAVLGPFNFPGHLPNGHIAPALVAGNTVVFKPSEHAPATAIEVTKLWTDAGLPSGVLNLVPGGAETGKAVVEDPELDGLLFTGSAEVGHRLHTTLANRPDKILAMEMGGNNPLVIEPVDDVVAAVWLVLQSAFVTAGQRCTCARRLLLPRGAFASELIVRLTEAVKALRVGRFDGPEPPFMGPVISEAAADGLLDAQARLLRVGGEPHVPMRKLAAGTGLVSPGLIDVTAIDELPDEEYFGPLLQIQLYESFDDAIAKANATRFGLAAGLVSDERETWEAFLREIRAGIVNWNRPLTGASSAAPFGGIGASGNHRPSAYYAADYCAYPVASLEQERVALPQTLPPGITL